MSNRPELKAPPEIFYDDEEACKYTSSSRIIEIQSQLSERALELLALPDDGVPRLLLDIGCGSGLSGETLSENGHQWIGLDISPSMLNIALEREVEGDLLLGDMGQGLGFRPGVIDGAISISAVQWLCNADKSSHEPRLRLKAFFGSLYTILARGARAVFQVYPETVAQRELILGSAMRAGFAGGVVIDYPHSSKKRKEFLVLTCGPPSIRSEVPKGKVDDMESCSDDESSEDENQTVSISDRHRPRARYAIGRLYKPPSIENVGNPSADTSEKNSCGTIGGLEAMNFITVATPHLGSRGKKQVPFLFGVTAFEKVANAVIHLIFRRTGRHLFLNDTDEGKPPLLRIMIEDHGENYFMSALHAFKRRVAYSNVGYDHIVGWRTSSIRRNSELPKWEDSLDEKYPHIVHEEYCKACDAEPNSVEDAGPDKLEEELVTGLSRVSWEKVDASFHSSRQRFAAHSLIQVKDEVFHIEGADVIHHMIDHFLT